VASGPISKTVSLALQGGASMGAYTWGVLDSLLEDGRLEFEGVTGASAGAINAVALVDGLAAGGREGARAALRRVWESIASACAARPRRRLRHLATIARSVRQPGSTTTFQDLATRAAARFEIDPRTMEPLRGVLEATIDWERVRASRTPRLFINATDVCRRTLRVFEAAEVSASAVCASCCVPLLFEPVEIDGSAYWDGGLLGNPAIYPVLYGCEASDVVLIETRPHAFDGLPRSARGLLSRLIDLSSTAGLVRELRMIEFVSELVRETRGPLRPGLREVRVHRISAHPALASLEGAGGFRADLPYLHKLHGLGREAGQRWLEEGPLTPPQPAHADQGGVSCTRP